MLVQAPLDTGREQRGDQRASGCALEDASGPTPNIDSIVRSLQTRLGERVEAAAIVAAVAAALAAYSAAPVKQFIPILVERRVLNDFGNIRS